MIDCYKVTLDIFGSKNSQLCHQYMKFHHYQLFIAAFSSIKLMYSTSMPTFNYINCKIEKKIKTHAFTLFIFNKSLIANNISVVEDFNVIQISIKRTDI